jgi:L-amino acid N-acyltransferase YncA
MQIKLAQREHLPQLVEISNWAAANTPANFATQPEPLSDWLASWEQTHRMYPWLVAVDDDVLGFAKASPYRSRGAYQWTVESSVYIAPTLHRSGLGTALYQRLISLLRAQGYITLFAGVVVGQQASEALHQKMGFTRCGVSHRAGWKFSQWYDVGFWEMSLSDSEPGAIRSVAEVWPLP